MRSDPADLNAMEEASVAAFATLRERREELRRELSTRYGVSLDLINRTYDDQLPALTGDAQKSIRALFTAISRSMGLPPVAALKLPPGAARA